MRFGCFDGHIDPGDLDVGDLSEPPVAQSFHESDECVSLRLRGVLIHDED